MSDMRLVHSDIYVASMKESLEFYVDGLGLSVLEDSIVSGELVQFTSGAAAESMRLVLLQVSNIGAGIELIEYQGLPSQIPRLKSGQHKVALSILVDDIRDLMSRLRSAGIEACSKIFTVDLPNIGRSEIVFYEDPDNYPIEFVQFYTRLRR